MLKVDSFTRSWIPFGYLAHLRLDRPLDLSSFLELSGKICRDFLWPYLLSTPKLKNCEGGPLSQPPQRRPLFTLEGDLPEDNGVSRPWQIQGASHLESVSPLGTVQATVTVESDPLFAQIGLERAIKLCQHLAPLQLQKLVVMLNFYMAKRVNILALFAPLPLASLELTLTPQALSLGMKVLTPDKTLVWDRYSPEIVFLPKLFSDLA